jgi:hypothetical protein
MYQRGKPLGVYNIVASLRKLEQGFVGTHDFQFRQDQTAANHNTSIFTTTTK